MTGVQTCALPICFPVTIPDQYNAPYSDLDGSADYLSKAGALGSDSQQVTINFTINTDSLSATQIIMGSGSAAYGSYEAGIRVRITTSGALSFLFANATDTSQAPKMSCTLADNLVIGRNYTITLSFDLTSTSKRWVFVNGVDKTSTTTWSTYNSTGTLNFSYPNFTYLIGKGDTYFNGKIGAFWFNTSYIDLSVPANLAKFVTGTGIDAKPVDLGANGERPTGTSPLIYLPMYGNNAGKNYGTGGDFTVNSGPYTGARGPNEYWASAVGDSGYLYRNTPLSGATDTKTLTFFALFKPTSTAATRSFWYVGGVASSSFVAQIQVNSGDFLNIVFRNSSDNTVLSATATNNPINSTSKTYAIHVSVDLSDTAKRSVYINGVATTVTWSTYTNDNMYFSAQRSGIGAE